MTFQTYWERLDADEKRMLAAKAETSVAYLSQVAHGHRRAGAGLIERLSRTDKKLSFQMMRQ